LLRAEVQDQWGGVDPKVSKTVKTALDFRELQAVVADLLGGPNVPHVFTVLLVFDDKLPKFGQPAEHSRMRSYARILR